MPSKCKSNSLLKLVGFTLNLNELQSLWKDKALSAGVFQTMHLFDPFPNMQNTKILSLISLHIKTSKCNFSLLINNYPPTLAPS